MILVQFFFTFAFLMVATSAKKTDTWPPLEQISKHFDIDFIVKTCLERSGVDKKELIEFEQSEDFEHLPNSKEIRLYFRCFGEVSEALVPNTNKIVESRYDALFSELSEEEKKIYIGIAKGCKKKTKGIKDLLEFTYEITVCFKRNDNEHFYVLY